MGGLIRKALEWAGRGLAIYARDALVVAVGGGLVDVPAIVLESRRHQAEAHEPVAVLVWGRVRNGDPVAVRVPLGRRGRWLVVRLASSANHAPDLREILDGVREGDEERKRHEPD